MRTPFLSKVLRCAAKSSKKIHFGSTVGTSLTQEKALSSLHIRPLNLNMKDRGNLEESAAFALTKAEALLPSLGIGRSSVAQISLVAPYEGNGTKNWPAPGAAAADLVGSALTTRHLMAHSSGIKNTLVSATLSVRLSLWIGVSVVEQLPSESTVYDVKCLASRTALEVGGDGQAVVADELTLYSISSEVAFCEVFSDTPYPDRWTLLSFLGDVEKVSHQVHFLVEPSSWRISGPQGAFNDRITHFDTDYSVSSSLWPGISILPLTADASPKSGPAAFRQGDSNSQFMLLPSSSALSVLSPGDQHGCVSFIS
jgi:hypothetical protein